MEKNMTSIEYLYSRYSEHGYISQKTYLLSIEMERNQIIRAINYSEMKHDELLKQAIEERRTVGEVYYDKIIKTK